MNEIEAIKQKIDLVDFIGNYLELKKAGSNYKALCPFHEERTPSFMVSAEKQIFKCFGCGEGGSAFDFLMKYENLEFREALKILAEKTGVTLRQSRPLAPGERPDSKSRLYKINQISSRVFEKILWEHPSARFCRDYLKKRGVKEKTSRVFRLGFTPQGTNWLDSFLHSRGFSQNEINQAGAPNRFYNRLMFPIEDQLANVVGFTGRALEDSALPKYLNTAETVLFNKSRLLYGYPQARQTIKEKKYAIVVEGQMDVIMAHQAGTTNVVASSGTALTKNHLKILSRVTQNLILAFDQDEAGQKAAANAVKDAQEFDLNVKLIKLPRGFKDPGEIIAQNPEQWKKALKNSLYFIEWLISQKLKEGEKPTVAEKKNVFRQILPSLALIADPIEQGHWIKFISDKLSAPQESIIIALEKYQNQFQGEQKNLPAAETDVTPPRPNPGDLIFGLLLKFSALKKKHSALYSRLEKTYNKENLAEMELLADKEYPDLKEAEAEGEILALQARISQKDQEKIKLDFASRIAQAEKRGDRLEVKKLLKKLQEKL